MNSNEMKSFLYGLVEYMIDKDWNDPEYSHIYEQIEEDYGEDVAKQFEMKIWKKYKNGTPDGRGNMDVERLMVRTNGVEYAINIEAV